MKTFQQFLTEALDQESKSEKDKIFNVIAINKSNPSQVLKMLNICDKFAETRINNTRTLDGTKVALKYQPISDNIFDIAYNSAELTKDEFDSYWDDPDEQDGVFLQGQDKKINDFEFFPKWIKVRSNKHFVSIGLMDQAQIDYGFDVDNAKKVIKEIANLKHIKIDQAWLDKLSDDDVAGIVGMQLI